MDTLNMTNVQLYWKKAHTELYLLIPLSVTLI